MKSLKKQAGFLGFIKDIGKAFIGGLGGSIGQGAQKAVGGAVTSTISNALDNVFNISNDTHERTLAEQKQLQDEHNAWSARQAQKQMIFQDKSQLKAQNFGQASADKSMDWMERMSNTAHQRQIRDLKKAGLNPILSASHGGASTPQGSSAQSSGQSGAQAQNAQTPAQSLSSAVQARQVRLAEKKVQAETELLQSQAQANMAQTVKTNVEASGLDYKQKERIDQIMNKVEYEVSKIHADTQHTDVKIAKDNIAKHLLELDAVQARYMLEQLDMEMDIYRSKRGKVYKEGEVASKSSRAINSAAGALASAAAASVVGLKSIKQVLGLIVSGKKLNKKDISHIFDESGRLKIEKNLHK